MCTFMGIAEPLGQGNNGWGQPVDINIDSFFGMKHISATAEWIIHPAEKLLFVFPRLLLGVPTALYRFNIVLSLSVVGPQVVHGFGLRSHFFVCSRRHANHRIVFVKGKPSQKKTATSLVPGSLISLDCKQQMESRPEIQNLMSSFNYNGEDGVVSPFARWRLWPYRSL